jgi:hypothetical protein
MKELNFPAGLQDKVISGDLSMVAKLYRRGSHDFLAGEKMRGMFGTKGKKRRECATLVAIAPTSTKPFKCLTNVDAHDAGFADRWELKRSLKALYPDIKLQSSVAIIRFRVDESTKKKRYKK